MTNAEHIISQSKFLQKLVALGVIVKNKKNRIYESYMMSDYWLMDSANRVWNMSNRDDEPAQKIKSVEQCELAAKALLSHLIKTGARI
jgi:hypothetical protein